jgi:predicted transcriptional regulator
MNAKFGIGVIIAIVLQVSAFVWWTAQQAQTIETLKSEVAELTAKSEIEKEVTLLNDVKQLQKDITELNDKTLKAILETHNRIDNLGQHVSKQDELINNTFASQMVEFEEKVQNSFNVVEGWVNELDTSVEDLYLHIDVTNQGLDKKLSDRIKDHKH